MMKLLHVWVEVLCAFQCDKPPTSVVCYVPSEVTGISN